ncbi:hypothetical protein I4U23_031099 [Adineta vaga]|nr:hypothetical protein I4U23_031099 [Adineta vaga]
MQSMLISLLSIVFVGTHCTTVGIIREAQIITNAPSVWLENQLTPLECLCYCFQHPSVFVVFNFYKSNSSCQLFSNFSSYPFQILTQTNVSVYSLEPLLPYAPCCSNLTWLMEKIRSNVSALNIPSITSVVLDNNNNRLAVVALAKLRLVSKTSFILLNVTINLPSGTQTISYYQDRFYTGIFPVTTPYAFNIYSTTNFSNIANMSFTQGGPQRIVWLFDNTLICVLLQTNPASISRANFYNWPSNTLNQSVVLGITNGYGLGKAPDDDNFVYITDGSWGGKVLQLKTTPPYTFTFFATSASSSESPTSVTVDSCNRLWVTFVNFGVRIYDIDSQSLLLSWNLTSIYPSLYDMVLTDQYQLYLADKNNGKLARHGTELQCTS